MPDETFRLSTTAFDEGGRIPPAFTCHGEDVSPALSWEGAPDGTASLVLIVDDPDAEEFVHWIVYGMSGSQSGALTEAVSASPDAPAQGRNDFGKIGWSGPCPPPGSEHTYRFTLHALGDVPDLSGSPDAEVVRGEIRRLELDSAILTGTYGRD
jgi:Raf kinase inhibitor-like YbhB/YbcL family protein